MDSCVGVLGRVEARGGGLSPPFPPLIALRSGEGGAHTLQNNPCLQSRAPHYCLSDWIGMKPAGGEPPITLDPSSIMSCHITSYFSGWPAQTVSTLFQSQSLARCHLSECAFFANYWPITALRRGRSGQHWMG